MMDDIPNYKLISMTTLDNNLFEVEIETESGRENIVTDDNATPQQLKHLVLAAAQTIRSFTVDNQIKLLKLVYKLVFTYAGSEEKKACILATISETDIHKFMEEKMKQMFTNQASSSHQETQNELILEVYNFGFNITDESITFVRNVWSTTILSYVKLNLCNSHYLQNKDDEYIFNLIDCSLGILYNVVRHIDASQRETLSTRDLKLSLTKLSEWSEKVALAALFTLSMLVDSSELSLLENQTGVLEHLVMLCQEAWESNLRVYNGCHLDELLTGLYYALRSDKLKMIILNQQMMEFLFEILQSMERQSEIEEVLIIFKQFSRCQQAKDKLVKEFDIITKLRNAMTKAQSHMKSMIQDLISIYSN